MKKASCKKNGRGDLKSRYKTYPAQMKNNKQTKMAYDYISNIRLISSKIKIIELRAEEWQRIFSVHVQNLEAK